MLSTIWNIDWGKLSFPGFLEQRVEHPPLDLPSSVITGDVLTQTLTRQEPFPTFTTSVKAASQSQTFHCPTLKDEEFTPQRSIAWLRDLSNRLKNGFTGARYYIGAAAACPEIPLQLTTSARLAACGQRLPGVQDSYFYISEGVSFGFLHKEDFNLQSANILRAGRPKIWLMIAPRDTDKVETRIAASLNLQHRCDQFIRHQNIILFPQQLDQWGIQYSVVVQNVGDRIVTDYRCYHQVFNTGPNFAEAVNGCEADWEPPISYRACKVQCSGGTPIVREHFLRAPETELKVTPQGPQTDVKPFRDLEEQQSRDAKAAGVSQDVEMISPSTPSSQRRGTGVGVASKFSSFSDNVAHPRSKKSASVVSDSDDWPEPVTPPEPSIEAFETRVQVFPNGLEDHDVHIKQQQTHRGPRYPLPRPVTTPSSRPPPSYQGKPDDRVDNTDDDMSDVAQDIENGVQEDMEEDIEEDVVEAEEQDIGESPNGHRHRYIQDDGIEDDTDEDIGDTIPDEIIEEGPEHRLKPTEEEDEEEDVRGHTRRMKATQGTADFQQDLEEVIDDMNKDMIAESGQDTKAPSSVEKVAAFTLPPLCTTNHDEWIRLLEEATTLRDLIFVPNLDHDGARDKLQRWAPFNTSAAWLSDDSMNAAMTMLCSTALTKYTCLPSSFLTANEEPVWADDIRDFEVDHLLVPFFANDHWELVDIDLGNSTITLYGARNAAAFTSKAARICERLQQPGQLIWRHHVRPPCRAQDNGFDCGFLVLVQVDYLLSNGRRHVPTPSEDLRIFYLRRLVSWATVRSTPAHFCDQILGAYPTFSGSSPRGALPPLTLRVTNSDAAVADLAAAFASPAVFANICRLRQTLLHPSQPQTTSVLAAAHLLAKSTALREWTEYHSSLADVLFFYKFLEFKTEARTEMHAEKRALRRSKNRARNFVGASVKIVPRLVGAQGKQVRANQRATQRLLRECGQDQNSLRAVEESISRGKALQQLLDLTDNGLTKPLWMLIPLEAKRPASIASTKVMFTDLTSKLRFERPRLTDQFDVICAGLRVVLGLEAGSLRLDTMDPDVLEAEPPDSDVLLGCLRRIDG